MLYFPAKSFSLTARPFWSVSVKGPQGAADPRAFERRMLLRGGAGGAGGKRERDEQGKA